MDDAPVNTMPLYRGVIETILARIVSGDLKPGAMLPSETDLGREMGVSQGTARKALSELVRRGILRRQQGRGTFVATTTPERDHFHFFRLRRGDGSAVSPDLDEETVRSRRATSQERQILDDVKVFEVSRVRTIDGRRIVREISVVPAALFAGLAERAPLPNALYAFYQQVYGVAILEAEEDLRAVLADDADAAAMDVDVGEALVEVRRRAIDISGQVAELRLSRYVTDDLRYQVRLR